MKWGNALHERVELIKIVRTPREMLKVLDWSIKSPKRPKKPTKRPKNSENMTFQKVDKSAPGKDSGRTAAWKILRG